MKWCCYQAQKLRCDQPSTPQNLEICLIPFVMKSLCSFTYPLVTADLPFQGSGPTYSGHLLHFDIYQLQDDFYQY